MSSGQVISLRRAKDIAMRVGNELAAFCDRIEVAGSVRREKIEVGDIELVMLPKKVQTGAMELFGGDTTKMVPVRGFIDTVLQLGNVLKGKADGRMMQIMLPDKVKIDLFMPEPYDFYRALAIRTGSWEYSQKVIATGWVKIGWCGTEDGLRLQKECENKPYTYNGVTKNKWTCIVDKPTLPPAWRSEAEFFEWIKVQYLHPRMRNL